MRVLIVSAFLFCSVVVSALPTHADDDAAARRDSAHAQFVRAQALREALEGKAERARTLQDYKDAVSAFRRVYLITPRAVEVPEAIEDVGELYQKMGTLFARSYFDSAVETYEYLLHEYPASHFCERALLAVANVQRTGLAQANLAEKTYEDFLQRYPHSANAAAARSALAEIHAAGRIETRRQIAPLPVSAPPTPGAAGASASLLAPSAPQGGGRPGKVSEVGHVRVWNADTYTRIVIDLGDQAKYQAARIANPDRIYFDIENANVSSDLLRQNIEVPVGGYLKSVRVAQNRANVVRVVLEVTQIKDYSVFELGNPDRLVVDVYGPNAQTAPGTMTAELQKAALEKTKTQKTESPKTATLPSSSPSSSAASVKNAAVVSREPRATGAIASAGAFDSAAGSVPASRVTGGTASRDAAGSRHAVTTSAATSVAKSEIAPDDVEASTPTPKPADSIKKVAETLGPATQPAPMHDGAHSLTRALGLKIGRIVIDAGHGGHDTGTIGPSGLMEKDVSLDVALRVGQLVAQRLPAAEIVYTRDDDKYVSLEKRTAIANQAKADLFLSIHANSSDDPATRGVETYYLNFSDTPEAMDVATRENAVAQGSVHDLQNLVSKIARNEKTEESRDFALDIQDSLANRTDDTSHSGPDRGVRKAPFVVLIGANMPSVLAEISFLSNPADEQWLKKPENRERIAEGLYRGIEAYLQSTNSLAANRKAAPPTAASSGAAHAGRANTSLAAAEPTASVDGVSKTTSGASDVPAARTAGSRAVESDPASAH
jgi:N-acetylmuramoyl-L-alanine amidase